MATPLQVNPGAQPQVPGFTLIKSIGFGSYGEVWLARDHHQIHRAVKIVYRAHFDNDRPYEREYQGIQRFEPVSRAHASQLAILTVGRNEEASFFYYAMELADDVAWPSTPPPEDADGNPIIHADTYKPRTIKTEIHRLRRVPVSDCIRIGISLATALEHLHRHGLIHRDIKPSNVIFVGGIPKLADIGLVTNQGMTVSFVGTEGFVPPEGPGTPSADLYALGKVLYEMATGLDRLDFPDLPTQIPDSTEQDRLMELNLVLLKACEGDVSRRYATAGQLLADLAILNSGGSLHRTRQLAYRWKMAQRGMVCTLILALLLVVGYFTWERHRESEWREQQRLSKEQAQIYRTAAEEKNARLIHLHLEQASQLHEMGDPAGAALWIAAAAELESSPAGIRQLQQAWSNTSSRIFWPQTRWQLTAPAVLLSHSNPNSQWLFLDNTGQLFRCVPDQAPVPLARRPLLLPLVGHAEMPQRGWWSFIESNGAWSTSLSSEGHKPSTSSGSYTAIALDPQGRWLLLGSSSGQITAYQQSRLNEKQRWSQQLQSSITAIAISPDGEHFAAALSQGSVTLGTMDDPELLQIPTSSPDQVTHLHYSQDSSRILAILGHDMLVWRTQDPRLPPFRYRGTGWIRHAQFLQDSSFILTVLADGIATLLDPDQGTEVGPRIHLQSEVLHLELHPDGSSAALVCSNKISLFSIHPAHGLRPLNHLEGPALNAHFSPNGQWLAVSRPHNTLELFAADLSSLREIQQAPPSQWKTLAQIASSRSSSPKGISPLPQESFPTLWHDWSTLITAWAPLSRSPYSWHEQRALEAQKQDSRFTAAFHWSQCQSIDPQNPAARIHLEQLGKEVPSPSSPPQAAPHVSAPIAPPRPAQTPLECIDLTRFYNANLRRPWLPVGLVSNDWSRFPAGLQKFGETPFDFRGLIQLSSTMMEQLGGRFPKSVHGIPIQRRLKRLDFIQATAWEVPALTAVGTYRIHYRDGQSTEIALTYGHNIREWWALPESSRIMTGAAVAWQGSNDAADAQGKVLRVYQMGWTNPRPDVEIDRLDFESAMGRAAPFLLALTATP